MTAIYHDVTFHRRVRTLCRRRRNVWRFLLGWPPLAEYEMRSSKLPMTELSLAEVRGGGGWTVRATIPISED